LLQNVVDAMLEVYSQTLMTNFSPETWATQGVTLVQRIFGTNGGQWFWVTYAETYSPSFGLKKIVFSRITFPGHSRTIMGPLLAEAM